MIRARLPAKALFVTILATFLTGCLEGAPSTSAPRAPVVEPIRTLAWGAHSSLAGEREAVIDDAHGWDALWREHAADARAPAVDFARERVVAVALGERASGCFAVRVTDATTDLDAGRTSVNVTERVPRVDEFCTQALVTPFHFVAIPRRDAAVDFAWRVGEFSAPPDAPLTDEPPREGEVAWRPLAAGQHSGIEDARRVVLSTESDYRAAWDAHAAYAEPRAEAPEVDFAKERVVAAWLGAKPNGCWHADVSSVTRDGARIVVVLDVVKPPRDAACADVVTHPFVLIAIPQGEEFIAWNETEREA